MGQSAHRLGLAVTLLLAAPILLLGQTWGLPDRSVDSFLFGSTPVWPGAKILRLAGGWSADPARGADVASSPLTDRGGKQIVNATDHDRAKILLRYRLYSSQPDEMITFRALAGMHPLHGPRGGMDPRMYQYGGLWIYPVGVLLKLLPITLRPDIAWYLDNPDAFGRFYVVARLYSAAWGLLGVAVVFLLVQRITAGWAFPATGGLLFALLPVVIDQSHEAKPHLAGAVLMLCAALAGSIHVTTGKRSAALACGAICGAAFGMVLSAYPVVLILPMMALLRGKRPWAIGAPVLVAIAVYVVTNPYVAINLVANRSVLRSNLGNSAAMYHAAASGSALGNAALLIADGTSALTALGGIIGGAMLACRAVRLRSDRSPEELRRRATGLLLASPALWIAVQFVAFASGKPGEYARFALYFDIVLAVEALVAIATFARGRVAQVFLVLLLMISTASLGLRYLAGFVRDAGPGSSRLVAARAIADERLHGKNTLLVADEPAPYCLPPVDVFLWQITLVPRGASPDPTLAGQISVQPISDDPLAVSLTSPRMSWADKRFQIGSFP